MRRNVKKINGEESQRKSIAIKMSATLQILESMCPNDNNRNTNNKSIKHLDH